MDSSTPEPPSGDVVIRAMTDDAAFRVIAARTTDTVRGAVRAQKTAGATAKCLGELITGSVLVRETMAPGLRVQGILQGAHGSGQLVADSHPDGSSRGLVQLGRGSDAIAIDGGALMQMMRTLPTGDLHRGVVEVPESGGISGALMSYMQNSEQVVSVIAVGCAVDGTDVVAAGGYIVQLLPEVSETPLAIMEQRLRDFLAIDGLLRQIDASPDALLSEILYGMPFTQLDRGPLRFACNCSAVRALSSLGQLSRADIEELMKGGEPLEMSCDYCGAEYAVEPEQLRGLLESS